MEKVPSSLFSVVSRTTSGTGTRYLFHLSGDTGISNVSASKKTNITYTLDGRRVENPTKGVYIVNGKMFVIK